MLGASILGTRLDSMPSLMVSPLAKGRFCGILYMIDEMIHPWFSRTFMLTSESGINTDPVAHCAATMFRNSFTRRDIFQYSLYCNLQASYGRFTITQIFI